MDYENSLEDDYKEYSMEESARRGFIRKVYSIILAQLTFTFLFTLLPMYNESFKMFQRKNLWLMIVVMVIYFGTALTLFCYYKVARSVPLNYIVLFIFTFTVAYMVSFSCASVKNKNLVGVAALMTMGVTLGLTIYAFTTKSDFTVFGSALCIAACSLLFFGLGFMIFGKPGKILYIIYLFIGIIVYSIFLIYDTQLIVGGKSYELDIDDYILAACMIYLDIIILFLKILSLLGEASD